MFLDSINFVDNRMAVSVYPDRHVWSSLRQEGMMEIVNSESPGQTFIEFAVSWPRFNSRTFVIFILSFVLHNSLCTGGSKVRISSLGKGRTWSPPLVLPWRGSQAYDSKSQTKARSSEKYLTIYYIVIVGNKPSSAKFSISHGHAAFALIPFEQEAQGQGRCCGFRQPSSIWRTSLSVLYLPMLRWTHGWSSQSRSRTVARPKNTSKIQWVFCEPAQYWLRQILQRVCNVLNPPHVRLILEMAFMARRK